MSLQHLQDLQDALIVAAHAQVASDAAKWRDVRRLALEAQGRSGYNDKYGVAVAHGVWRLNSSSDSWGYTVAVDMIKGKLCRAHKREDVVSSIELRRIAGMVMDDLDVDKVLAALRDEASRPEFSNSYFTPMSEAERDRQAAEAGFERLIVAPA